MLKLLQNHKRTSLSVGIYAVSIFLRISIPTRPHYLGLHDDDWMVSNAYWLAKGEFVRPWTILSMNKELGYPIFLVISKLLHIAPVLLAHLSFILVSGLLVHAVKHYVSRGSQTVLLVALILNPAIFGLTASRIYRDMWTIVLALSLLTLVLNLLLNSPNKPRLQKQLLICILGFTLSLWLRMTRVDTYWILIVILIPSVPMIVQLLRTIFNFRRIEFRSVQFGVALLLVSIGLGQLTAPHLSAEINNRRYGVNLSDDFFMGEFATLFKTWSSIKTSSKVAYTPINREQRLVGYGQSPLLRNLEPQIEGNYSSGWLSISCQATLVCDDFAGGYFAHAVRDAYSDVYPRSNGTQFQKFMRDANRELREGCDTAKIQCGAKGLNTQLPSFSEIDWTSTLGTASSFVFNRSLKFNDSVAFEAVGTSEGPNRRAWKDIVGVNYGMQKTDLNGTHSWLRTPIKMVFAWFGWLLTALVSIGLLSLLTLMVTQRRSVITWLGFGCLAGVGIHAFIIAIAAQNSMGPLSFDGVWELTYLLQEIPFLVIGGVVGLDLLFTPISRSQLRIKTESGNVGVE